MVYPYSCKKHGEFDVVKHHSESSKPEKCPKCKKVATRVWTSSITVMGAAVQNAEFNPGLGQVVKNKYHREEICKARGLVEVGNEKPKTFRKHFAAEREQKRRKVYDEV